MLGTFTRARRFVVVGFPAGGGFDTYSRVMGRHINKHIPGNPAVGAAITRPYALPPGTPKERVQILRRAFQETMKDRDFLAEAAKSKLDVNPVSGEEVEKIVSGLFKLDAATIARMSEILK
jgi:tripartite-type tricarboxylate transporter receptor subunit TctC